MIYSSFDFHGYKISLKSQDFSLDEFVSIEEFSYFSDFIQNSNIQCEIVLKKAVPEVYFGLPVLKTKMGVLRYLNFYERQMVYKIDGSVVATVNDKEKYGFRRIQIVGSHAVTLNEILYYVMMSVSGEQLDARGFMRLHAASFWQNGRTTVIWGKPKAGKSTLTQAFLKDETTKIYSDEMTLFQLGTKKIFPFPNLISIAHTLQKSRLNFFPQKAKITIPKHKIAPQEQIGSIYWLQKSLENSSAPMPLVKKLIFYVNILFGVGLIQMSEFLIRPTNLRLIFRIAYNRLSLIFQLASIPTYEQFRNRDVEQNIPLIKNSVFFNKTNN